MSIIEISHNSPLMKEVVSLHLYRKAGMLSTEAFDEIHLNTSLRQLYYMIGDSVATKLWIVMKDMGGSVSG